MTETNPQVKVEPAQIKIPQLGVLFFAVCKTAIKNTAWKRSDFEKITFVEGQLDQLQAFFVELGKETKPVEAPVEEAGIAIEGEQDKLEGTTPPQVEAPQPEPVKPAPAANNTPAPAPSPAPQPAEPEKKKS